jgi:hypothetical protein
MKLDFPTNKSRYYDTYCHAFRLTFDVGGIPVNLDPSLEYLAPAIFYVRINGKLVLVDFSDFVDEYSWDWSHARGFFRLKKHYNYKDISHVPIFKRTMGVEDSYPENVFPHGPMLLLNSVQKYNNLLGVGSSFDFNKRNKILHTNRLYAASQITRKRAFEILDSSKLLSNVEFDSDRVEQNQHLNRLGLRLATLEIGACPNAQGSGAIDAIMTGTPVISNNMDIVLPFGERLQKHRDYVYVEEDYSNINEAINWVYDNRDKVKDMADNSYDLFMRTWHYRKLLKWFEQVVEEWYERNPV